MNFHISVDMEVPGTYEEAYASAMRMADSIWNDIVWQEAHVCVSERGEPEETTDGVFCEGCCGHTIPGVRWPTSPSGYADHEYVERCDTCRRYGSDEEAQARVREIYEGTGATISTGTTDGFLWVDVK